MLHQIFIAAACVLCTPMITKAQGITSQASDSTARGSEVRIGLRYSSDYYYMGRADSAKAPYLTPSIGYYHKSGLSIRGSLSYLVSTENERVDLYTLSGGYDYFGKKTAVGVSVTQYFFNDLSYSVQAEMNTYLDAYLGYDLRLFIVYADIGVGLSDGADVFTGGEITRTFFALRNKVRITPSLYVNAGSQKYYSAYYAIRSTQTGSGKGKGNHGQPRGDVQMLESEKFQILDYEASAQVSYVVRNLRLYISATWTFPVNPSTISTDQGTYEEELENGFYWSSGVRITLAGRGGER